MTQNESEDCNINISSEASSDDENAFIMQQQHFINKKNADHTECSQQIQTMLKRYNKSEQLRRKTKNKLIQAKMKIKRLKQEVRRRNNLCDNIKKRLGDDQIKLLCGEYKKVPIWCSDTVKKALKYKFVCGNAGYEEIARDWPLPSLRTLSRRLDGLKFQSGILDEVF